MILLILFTNYRWSSPCNTNGQRSAPIVQNKIKSDEREPCLVNKYEVSREKKTKKSEYRKPPNYYHKKKIHSGHEIEDFVQTHICKLCVIF